MEETYVLHITKKCNCCCNYCYEKDKESKYTLDGVEHTFLNILKYSKNGSTFGIEFLGGEPMLAFEYIQHIVELYKNKYANKYNINFTITTNGTILQEEHLLFLKNNKNLVRYAISLDGDKVSNQLRVFKDTYKNTYDVVEKNMYKLKENNIPMSLHIVTHPYNISRLASSLVKFENKGFAFGCNIGIIESTIAIDDDYIAEYKRQIRKIVELKKNNKLKNIIISDLLFPPNGNDRRTYVKSSDKTILETYGRAEGDITSHTSLDVVVNDEAENTIAYDLRMYAYNYYNQK